MKTSTKLFLQVCLVLAIIAGILGLGLQTQSAIAQATNLALNKPVTFSSQQAGNEASHAVDGSTTTRWAAEPWPQWIQVDLGATNTIDKTEFMPYASRAYKYRVEVSLNGTTYTTVVDKTANTVGGATLTDTFAPASARYVRLTITGATGYTGLWASLYEFRVFNTAGGGPTATKTNTPVGPTPTKTNTPVGPTATPPAGWNLVWSDEFNGPSVDMTNWSFQTGCSGWGNGEWEDYTSGANTSFESGVLVIEARMKPGSPLGNCGMTSTRMNTSGKRSWLYGKMEARIAIPMGQGVWPAFWMMGNTGGWPSNGEMDIMEHINSTDQQVGTLHWNNGGHQSSGKSVTVANMTSYHTYGIEWDTNEVKFYVDSNYYNTINIASVPQPAFHQPQYFLLNLAIGGAWPGYPTSTNVMPAKYYIDYVRVYQH
jgi:beta-glucanase (GH16 family)